MRRWCGIGLCLVVGATVLVFANTSDDSANLVDGVDDLALLFAEHQYMFLPIAPPIGEIFFQDFGLVLPVDWTGFPQEFIEQLYPEMDSYGYPLYPISIYEDRVSRDTVFLNMYGTEIYRLAPASDYDPYAWQTEHFGLEPGEQLEEPYRWYYDPARIAASLILIPERFYEDFLAVQAREASFEAAMGSMGMMMSLPSTITNLVVAIEETTNGTVEVQVGWPAGFTNNLEIFATTNLVETSWKPVCTNIVTVGETNYVWVDEDSTNLLHCYYTVGNADLDTDGDTLTDAREFLLYGTDPLSADTDGDYMDDAWELEHSFDPNNDLDMVLDPDQDMLPNVYEHHYGLNPHANDSGQVTKLWVDPGNLTQSNTYASIRAAFTASSPYSIIEIVPGVYSGRDNTGLDFPAHPVLLMSDNWGIGRRVEIQSERPIAFALGDEQDNRTIVRGLNLDLSGAWPIQIGFYLGEGVAPFSGAAPYFDGVQVTMGASDWTIGVYGLGPSEKTVRFNNCILRGPGGQNSLSGIYLANAPSVHIANCSFLNFNSASVTSPAVALAVAEGDTGHAAIQNCFWDASFGSDHNYPVAHLGDSGDRYQTEVSYTVAPNSRYFLDVDSISSMTQTNEIALLDGLILSNSACINAAGVAPLTWYDFHGQARDGSPDIGADEYSAISTNNDTDADGLTDSEEAFEYLTSIFDADTDNDGVKDGDEVSCGTQPTNSQNYCVTIAGEVDDRTGLSASIRASYDLGTVTWNAANATNVVNGEFTYENQIINSPYGIVVQVLIDLNGNGMTNYGEPYYSQTLAVTDHTTSISFVLEDADGDGVDDADEIDCETDPNHPDHYCVTLQGTVTNQSGQSGPLRAAAVLIDPTARLSPYTLAHGRYESTLLEQVEVATNGAFFIEDLVVDQRTSNEVWNLWLNLYQDINTNEVMEHFEPHEQILVNVTNHTMTFNSMLSTNEVDLDGDLIPDWWEAINGMSYTNKADRFADFDGDWIDNKWEYDLGLDPNSYDTNSYAFADAMRAVDSRIAGKDPATAIKIYSVENHTAGVYERNTNCWAADIDFTSCSPWNSDHPEPYKKAGTLVSPRHVLFVNHIFRGGSFWVPPGETLRFVDSTGGVYTATVAAVHHVDTNRADITVAVLTEDVPTNQFSFAKVLPGTFSNYFGRSDMRVPALCLDQEEKALVHELHSVYVLLTNEVTWVGTDCAFRLPINGSRTNYYDRNEDLGPNHEGLRSGDSGNPAFIILNEQPILVTLWVYGYAGTGSALTNFRDEINEIMSQSGGYSLTEIDLSSYYEEIPEALR